MKSESPTPSTSRAANPLRVRSGFIQTTHFPFLTIAFLMTLLPGLAAPHSNNTMPADSIALPPSAANIWTLPNGLVLIVERNTSAPVASVQAWCKTGSIHEDKKTGAGLSHILEHMLFKGTDRRGANDIAREIQDNGGYINAYTSYDRTVYWIDIPVTGVATAVDVLTDAMLNSTLPETEYGKEQEVIRREFAMGFDDPMRVLSKTVFETSFRVYPARHPIIGYLDVYNALTRDDVYEYYKKRYVPNNMFFVVVGDVDPEAVYKQVAGLFEKVPRAALEPVYLPEEPAQLGRRERHEEFDTDVSRINLTWHIPGITHPDLPALDVLAGILGMGRSSRFYTTLREREELAFSIHSQAYTPSGPGLFFVGAVCDPDKREQLVKRIIEIATGLAVRAPEEAEVARAKRMILASLIGGMETMNGKASDLGSNWLLTGNLDFTRTYLEKLQAVTPEEVRRVAATYLRDDQLNVVSLNPKGTNPKPAENPHAAGGGAFTKSELSNGLRLLAREDRRLPMVSISVAFRSGVLTETEGREGTSSLLSRLLLKGTSKRSADEIAREIEEAGGSISSGSGMNSFYVQIEVLEPAVELAMEILGDVLANATLPADAIERERAAQLAAIRQEEDNLLQVAFRGLRESLYGSHPYSRRPNGTAESLARISREDLVTFRERHLAGRNGVVSVTGAVSTERARELVQKHLGNLPAGELAFWDVPEVVWPTAAGSVTKPMPKQQAILTIGYPGLDLNDPANAAIQILTESCSDLGSRFFDRIREQMGLAYFVGATHQSGFKPGILGFYLGTDPEKLAEVLAAMESEIASLAESGLTDEEISRARSKILGEIKIDRQDGAKDAFRSAIDELMGLGFDHARKFEKEIENAAPREINSAIRRILAHPARMISVVKPESAGNGSKGAE